LTTCGTPQTYISLPVGFLVNDMDEAVEAVRHLDEIDRDAIRNRFEERFSARRMAHDYVEIYRRALQCPNVQSQTAPSPTRPKAQSG